MKAETTWTGQFLKKLRAFMPDAEIIKFNSFGAAVEGGIPDFCIVRFDLGPHTKTVWVEVKILPSNNRMFKPLQRIRLERLGGWYIVWHTKDRKGWLFRASEYEKWMDSPRYTQVELIERLIRFF